MTSRGRIPYSSHSVGQSDLDLQPVREAKVRVLNDIPKEPVVPPPPKVKFNFVNVKFPKETQKPKELEEHCYGNTSRDPTEKGNTRNERKARERMRYDKENSNNGRAQRNMERDRREYLNRLLRKGLPVWEEVPLEERVTKVIGGTNPFRHHPYCNSPLSSNILHRTSDQQKSNRVIDAVWEDVQDDFKNSYPLEHNGGIVDTPREYLMEGKETNLKSRAEQLNQTVRNSSQSDLKGVCCTPSFYHSESISSHEHHPGHNIHSEVHQRTYDPAINPVTFPSELYEAEVSQICPTTQELIGGHTDADNSQVHEQPENPPEHLESEGVPLVQEVHSSRREGTLQDMMEQGRVSRPAMKASHSSQVDNGATSSISWWPGDRLYKERSKNEEEEKHEKESTKEKTGKRDLSASPLGTQKKRQVLADQEETGEKAVKSPVRVRHYEPDEVRKYIRDKQTERAKAVKEQQRKQEQEKIQRTERMRELAIKTKQLSQASKKASCKPPTPGLSQEQRELEQQPIVNWGAQNDWDPADHPEALPAYHTGTQPKEQNISPAAPLALSEDSARLLMRKGITKQASHSSVLTPKKESNGETSVQKKSRKERRKKKRQSLSDSETISDIVSRTVEECERKVKSSSVSVESLSSLSSYSCSSSDAESRSGLSHSDSLSSGLDLTPKERAVALGKQAQQLTSRVTQKVGSFSQKEIHKEDVPDMPQKVLSSKNEKQAAKPASVQIHSERRPSLSLSQIETMSVEELIAKMTAMLPNKSTNGKSAALQHDQNKNRNISERYSLEHNVQTRGKAEHLTGRLSHDVSMRESLERVPAEQLPQLVIPDVPKLKLSNTENKLQVPKKISQEDLSTLPGYNIMESGQNAKPQPDVGKQVFVKLTPSRNLQHSQAFPHQESHMAGRQQNQSQTFSRPHRKSGVFPNSNYEKAAKVIQAAYRGYRVRKITNSLIKRQKLNKERNTSEGKYFKGMSSFTHASFSPKSKKFCNNRNRIVDGESGISQEELSKEDRQENNWQEIQSELEQRTFKPHNESYYVSQMSDLPEWIKPYFVLTETGDLNHFLETQINKPEVVQSEGAENKRISIMANQSLGGDTVNPLHVTSEKSVHDVTLTEGPLSDIEKETVYCFDKETQTSYNKYLHSESEAKSEHTMDDFIDIKKFSKRRDKTVQDESFDSHKGEFYETPSRVLNTSQLGLSGKEHGDTLEERPFGETVVGENSSQATENETLESGSSEPNLSIEEGPINKTSEILGNSNTSSFVAVEEASVPHELLGEGVHLGPASLRLRLNAELMYQDTLGKALNHLHNVEQLNILNESRQEAMALSRSLALEQQKLKLTSQRKNANGTVIQDDEAKRKEQYQKRLREKMKPQEEALQKVEQIEKEARSRFAELEREVRSKAEQMIAQAAERIPQPSIAQSDVIAAAAVAAVGATVSQWKQLRPVRGHESLTSITQSERSSFQKISSDQFEASSEGPLSDKPHSLSDKPYSEICSARSMSREHIASSDKSSVPERLNKSFSKSSLTEELPSGDAASKTSTAAEVISDVKSSQNSASDNITSIESSIHAMSENVSQNEPSIKSSGNGCKRFDINSNSQGTSVSEKVDSVSSTKSKTSLGEIALASNIVTEDISSVKNSQTGTEAISKKSASAASSSEIDTMSNALPSSSTLKSSSSAGHRKHQNEMMPSKKAHGFPLSNFSKSKAKERKKEERDASDIYSESFEVDSESEDSNTSQLQSQDHGAHGNLTLVVSSSNVLNDLGYKPSTHASGGVTGPVPGVGGETALGVTVSVVESLLKEEEVHHQHQKTLLKLQEQSLVEEAKWKLAALQSEGGPGVRRRQRAIVLQLREQKAHLKRLRETQNIGAQQRRLMLLQFHHLLATTSSLSGYNAKGYLTAPRGHSPNPASPRLTPRLMEMLSSSSSDPPDDVTFSLLMRGRDSDSSSPSESGGAREKRRSHSEDRLKICSGRHHDKRWTAEIEALQQQILQEDKEILRLKSKSPYDIHDKDSVKLKRKGDFINKRPRDKKEKCSGSISPLSVPSHGSRVPVDNSVPTENTAATIHDSQSSIPEEGGSETISHSDAASSVSEQEGLSSTSHRTGNSKSKEVIYSKSIPSFGVSERETSKTHTSKPKIISNVLEPENIAVDYLDSRVSEKSISTKTVSNGEISRSVEERCSHHKSEQVSKLDENSDPVNSEIYDKSSKSQESSIRTKHSASGSVTSVWHKSESAIPEDITDSSKLKTTSSSFWHGSDIKADSGTRSSDSKPSEDKSCSQKSSSRCLPLPLKIPLSPRSLHRQHRRYSSESDDSFTLSQTETASDISDGEGKLLALKEELATRRAEAERLKKEKKRMRRERLASQERALRQQISTYDAYIQNARMELEKESKEMQQVSMVRPLIKKPQVAETKKSRLSESVTSPEKSEVSDVSLVSEGSGTAQSSIKPQETSIKEGGHVKLQESIKLQELHLKQIEASFNSQDVSSSSGKDEETEEKPSFSKDETLSDTARSQGENSSEKASSSSISEDLNEESFSEDLQDDSNKKSLSQESSVESDHTHSQASSTETIVHSPQKLDPSQKEEVGVSVSEVNAALLEVLKDNERNKPVDINTADATDARIEGDKLEIFLPTSGFKSFEGEELAEGNTNTSAEQSICEELLDDNLKETKIEDCSPDKLSRSLMHPVTVEDEVHEESDECKSFIPEKKERELPTKTYIPSSTIIKGKETSSEGENRTQPPTLDQQRLVDDISNNLLAVMIRDTSQLFTNIVKEKVNISKASEVVKESGVTQVKDDAIEFQESGSLQSHIASIAFPEGKTADSKPSSNSKSHILQRVNELIGDGGPGSPHLTSLSSPRSGNVQLTFDLSPESSPSVSPVIATTGRVEEAGEVELLEGAPPSLLVEETATFDAAVTLEEEEQDSLSPSHDVVKAEEYKLDTETLTTRLLNLASAPELDLDARLGQLNENTEFSVEGIEGDWFDDDFWTSSDNRKKQQQLKAEEERITAEIARLEELQHLQQKYPGLVIREIPNKPPPPYTPPQVTSPPSGSSPTPTRPPAYTSPPASPVLPEAQPLTPTHSTSISHRLSKADQRKLAAHITQVVPISEEEALPIINNALDALYEAWQSNIDPADIPPPSYTTLAKAFSLSSFNDEEMHEDEKTSSRAFHLLLFCLARELLSVPYKLQHATPPPPWMKQVLPQARMLGMVHTKSRAGLFSHVREQVKVLFGWRPSLHKESLMIRWAQKHRDLVDQVLVKELQAEEASWTNYDEDEAAVKTKVASEILDTLISETVSLVSSILVKKIGYIAH